MVKRAAGQVALGYATGAASVPARSNATGTLRSDRPGFLAGVAALAAAAEAAAAGGGRADGAAAAAVPVVVIGGPLAPMAAGWLCGAGYGNVTAAGFSEWRAEGLPVGGGRKSTGQMMVKYWSNAQAYGALRRVAGGGPPGGRPARRVLVKYWSNTGQMLSDLRRFAATEKGGGQILVKYC
jgi:hypothetical protein